VLSSSPTNPRASRATMTRGAPGVCRSAAVGAPDSDTVSARSGCRGEETTLGAARPSRALLVRRMSNIGRFDAYGGFSVVACLQRCRQCRVHPALSA
jgi:hypothetical protein